MIGSVSIYNNKLSERADLENLIKITGVCPQSNLQFDFLTVRENLRLFAKIRGIPPQEVDKEVYKYIQTNVLVKIRLLKSICTSFFPLSDLCIRHCINVRQKNRTQTRAIIYI